MTSQDDIRKENKKDLEERLEVVNTKTIPDTITVPKQEYEKLKQENDDLRKMTNGLAQYLLNLVPVLEDTSKKLVLGSNSLFTLGDNIKAIARPTQQAQQNNK